MVTEQRVNTDTLITNLRRLLVNALRPMYPVVDGHPVHRSKKAVGAPLIKWAPFGLICLWKRLALA